MKKHSRQAGIFFVIVGLIIILSVSRIITGSIWKTLHQFWPVLLIIAGVFLIFKMRWIAASIIGIIAVLGLLYLIDFHGPTQREILQQIDAQDMDEIEMNLDFGAGQVYIAEGNLEHLVTNKIMTSDIGDPEIKYSDGKIRINREGFPIFGGKPDMYNITLSPDPIYSMYLNYGASSVHVDLSNLKVSSIELNSGAADSTIVFGSYPTRTEINTGASTINLIFPKDANVKVIVDGGLVTVDAKDYRQENSVYYSKSYNSEVEGYVVKVGAGVTTIKINEK